MSHPQHVVSKHVVIGGLCLPLDVEAMESLPVDAGGLIRFDFVFRSIRFVVRYEDAPNEDAPDEARGGRLKLVGDVGPIPYTAEAPAARAGLAHIVLDATDVLGASFRFAEGHILLAREFAIDRPVTASKLMGAVAAFLVPAIPYLDLIAVYIRPPLAPRAPGETALKAEWRRKPLPKR